MNRFYYLSTGITSSPALIYCGSETCTCVRGRQTVRRICECECECECVCASQRHVLLHAEQNAAAAAAAGTGVGVAQLQSLCFRSQKLLHASMRCVLSACRLQELPSTHRTHAATLCRCRQRFLRHSGSARRTDEAANAPCRQIETATLTCLPRPCRCVDPRFRAHDIQ
jgi:hypothetical protein